MSLSNLNKENLNNLFQMLELSSNHEIVESVRTNYSTYSKLELLSRQMMMLKKEAQNILENHQMSQFVCCLSSIQMDYQNFPELQP